LWFVTVESTVLIFIIFRSSKIRVSPTDVVSSFFPPWCRLSSDRRHYAAASCHASFKWSQNELAASTSSSDNDSSCRLTSRAKTKALNLHYRCRPPSPDCATLTLRCYKKIISTLVTLPTTESCLHFGSSLGRTPCYRSYTHHHCSLSLTSHIHHPSAQRHPRWQTSRLAFTSWSVYRCVNSQKKYFKIPQN
jgi:hypothetical protein